MSTDDDRDLRALLHETADQITPHGTLDELRARTEKNPVRRWALPALAAAAVLAVVAGGIGWALRDDGSPTGATRPPATSPSGTPTTGTEQLERTGTVYYLGDTVNGPRLFPERTTLHADGDTDTGYALDAVDHALAGEAADPDYRSAWPTGLVLGGLGQDPGSNTIQVTFATDPNENRPDGMTEEVARLSVEQVVRSAQAWFGKPLEVEFFVESPVPGHPGGAYLSEDRLDSVYGVDTSRPVGASDDDSVLAPVQITSLTDGQTVKAGPLKVEGMASTFEGNVVWEARAGSEAESGFITAAECCTLSPYSFTVDLAPGTYTIVAHDTDESGDVRVNQDTKEIIVE